MVMLTIVYIKRAVSSGAIKDAKDLLCAAGPGTNKELFVGPRAPPYQSLLIQLPL